MSNDKKSAQLGMSFSTARSRLVKMLLFRALQQSGEDTCFKCGAKIEDIDHLSIEHKVYWLNNDPALFWDLDNVTYSHLACNKPDNVWNKYPTRDEALLARRRASALATRKWRATPEGKAMNNKYARDSYARRKTDDRK